MVTSYKLVLPWVPKAISNAGLYATETSEDMRDCDATACAAGNPVYTALITLQKHLALTAVIGHICPL